MRNVISNGVVIGYAARRPVRTSMMLTPFRSRPLVFAAVLGVLAAAIGCGGAWHFAPTPGPADSGWPTAGGDLSNTARSRGHGATGVIKWTFNAGVQILNTASIGRDGTIYFGATANHNLYAITPADKVK